MKTEQYTKAERLLLTKIIDASGGDYNTIEDEIQSVTNHPAHQIVVNSILEYTDQEKQALKDELIKKVKESNLSGLSKATVYTLITQS